MTTPTKDHFQGKSAIEHIHTKKASTASEVHGEEIAGHMGAGLEALRDTSIVFLSFWINCFCSSYRLYHEVGDYYRELLGPLAGGAPHLVCLVPFRKSFTALWQKRSTK